MRISKEQREKRQRQLDAEKNPKPVMDAAIGFDIAVEDKDKAEAALTAAGIPHDVSMAFGGMVAFFSSLEDGDKGVEVLKNAGVETISV